MQVGQPTASAISGSQRPHADRGIERGGRIGVSTRSACEIARDTTPSRGCRAWNPKPGCMRLRIAWLVT
jgi:hypothetical protein